MGLFGSKKEGGFMDVIRSTETSDFVIWKWSPDGKPSYKENAIRYGSSLRVKDGEVAVFVYKQSNGTMQDFIEGPFDQTIKTANFPVLTSIVGAAFGGSSPFQAEIYFINMAGVVKIPFYIPRVNIFDPRKSDYFAPASVKGSVVVNITDYRKFIKCHKLLNMTEEDLYEKIKDPIVELVSSLVGRFPKSCNVSLFEITSHLIDLGRFIQPELQKELSDVYGLNVVKSNLSDIIFDTSSSEYQRLDKVLRGREEVLVDEQYAAATRNIEDERQLNLDLRARMNEEAQRMQKLQSETTFIGAHQINVQGEVAKTAAESLGQMGAGASMSFGDGGGMNPAAMMTGMMMGGAVGGSMANMMGNMMQGVSTPQPPPPPPGVVAEYHIVNKAGAQCGPFNMQQLKQMISQGEINMETYVWKQGMSGWAFVKDVPEVRSLFGAVPPPPPPPIPGM